VIPFLQPLADYGWAVGLASALALYVVFTRLAPPAEPDAPASVEPASDEPATAES
jgi:NCS1 family nucleobase:cation symporter-1